MRNSEVYGYIERLHDAIYSGLPDGDVIDEVQNVLADFGEEVLKETKEELNRKYGIESTSFFTKLAEADDEELMSFCERMDEVHPALGKFAKYLMEEDDPTFFIAYGDEPKLTGRSSGQWAYDTADKICNHFREREYPNDK